METLLRHNTECDKRITLGYIVIFANSWKTEEKEEKNIN